LIRKRQVREEISKEKVKKKGYKQANNIYSTIMKK